MKKGLLITVASTAILIMACAIYWMQINIVPNVTLPKQTMPSLNAYDVYQSASKLAWYGPNDELDGVVSTTPKQRQAILAKNLPVLAKAREAFSYPYVEPSSDPLYPDPDKREFPGMKEEDVARIFAFAGKVYAEEHDWDDAMRCDLDAVQVGNQISTGIAELTWYASLRCERYGIRPAWPVIDHLNRAQTIEALERLKIIQKDSITMSEQQKRWQPYEQSDLAKLFRNPSWRKQYPFAIFTSVRTIMQNDLAFRNEWVRRMRGPYATTSPFPKIPADAYHQKENEEGASFSGGTSSAYGGGLNYLRMYPWFQYTATQTQSDLLLLALALHAYKLDHNSYPSTLSQLAPAYLKNIPSDPFAERGPMRYRRMKETYLLYSVGPDGKDNGGTPIFQPLTIAGKPYGRARYGIINMNSKGDIVAGINAML